VLVKVGADFVHSFSAELFFNSFDLFSIAFILVDAAQDNKQYSLR